MATSGGPSGGGGGTGAVKATLISVTAGNVTCANISTFQPIGSQSGGTGVAEFDLAVPAVAGDIIQVSPNFIVSVASLPFVLDMLTVPGGNWLGSGSTTSLANGVAAWMAVAAQNLGVGASVFYTVKAADLSGGNVTFRPYVKSSTPATNIVTALPATPFNVIGLNITALVTGT